MLSDFTARLVEHAAVLGEPEPVSIKGSDEPDTGVISVAGPAGIGKSRLVGETVALAKSRGVEVFSAFCESHTREIPFRVAARLLREAAGITDLEGEEFFSFQDPHSYATANVIGPARATTINPTEEQPVRTPALTA